MCLRSWAVTLQPWAEKHTNRYLDSARYGKGRFVLTQELLYRLASNTPSGSGDEDVAAFKCEE